MKINLGDIIPTSTLDWPGKVVMTIFMRGCPLKCPYCSNSQFMEVEDDYEPADIEKVKGEIDKAKDFIDGIVLSGGEPFMQMGAVRELAKYAKSFGLLVGIQTNGMYPDRIKELNDEGSLDAVFLDVKAPLKQGPYLYASGYENGDEILQSITRSIEICARLRSEGKLVYYEARTTVLKDIADMPEDVAGIAGSLGCCDSYVIQQGRPELAWEEKMKGTEAIPRNELLDLARTLRARQGLNIKKLVVRTRELGDETV
ncbi:anaerobic ribonucleoside-triphosphate reductase activating protein [Methanocella sp. CWC-04]|uniref:Anaerobic ribonucleoside-triphosphate reductase activating protein n=1 Tax=Methanooceanicella nereidis TaxID=2052831 RepID=A0AAP2RC87_9EURY|nr:anaerobic ribonucleoside-triphosphate reductase activating protein [Methanocella sp. CWC-04]MCD1294594.1 anaerobic ribonucleoside-triphosphate reductase activating protein [Methanocella sp. CWC-04]